jgi:hypothetical protein
MLGYCPRGRTPRDGGVDGRLRHLESEQVQAIAAPVLVGNLNPAVLAMEPTKNGANDKATPGVYHPRKRRVFVQRQVSSTLIVILLVRTQQIAQMPFAKYNDMVEAACEHRPFRVG